MGAPSPRPATAAAAPHRCAGGIKQKLTFALKEKAPGGARRVYLRGRQFLLWKETQLFSLPDWPFPEMVWDLFICLCGKRTQLQVREGNLKSCQIPQYACSPGPLSLAHKPSWARRAPPWVLMGSGLGWGQIKQLVFLARHSSSERQMWMGNIIFSSKRLQKTLLQIKTRTVRRWLCMSPSVPPQEGKYGTKG